MEQSDWAVAKKMKRVVVNVPEDQVYRFYDEFPYAEVYDVHCDHQWNRERTFEVVTTIPCTVQTQWLDIPNGEDGDYVMVKDAAISQLELSRQEKGERVYCSICGAETEDGWRVF